MLIGNFLGSKEPYNTCHLSESGMQKTDAKKLESLIRHILPTAEFSFSLDCFKMLLQKNGVHSASCV